MRWISALLAIVLVTRLAWAASPLDVVETPSAWKIPALSLSLAKTAAVRVQGDASNQTREMPEYLVYCTAAAGRCDVVITAWRGANAEQRHQQLCNLEKNNYTLGHERIAVGGHWGELYIGPHGPSGRRAFVSVVVGGWWLRFSIDRPTAQFNPALARLRQVVAAAQFQ